MSYFYLIAVTGTRLIGVMMILIVSHLLPVEEFGRFAIISTNALLIQLVAGGWLVSLANRILVSKDGVTDQTLLDAVATAAVGVVALVVVVTLAYGALGSGRSSDILFTGLLASCLIAYDLTLTIKNAVGREAAYAGIAMIRNVAVLVLSVTLAFLEPSAFSPAAALVAGTILPLVALPHVRRLWAGARIAPSALSSLSGLRSMALSGGLLLGIYILVNAPTRNIFAQRFGEAAAGAWTLCTDLSYGPLAVIGNAYALSQVRLIYMAAAEGNDALLATRARDFIEACLAISLPYCLAGILFGENVAVLVLSGEQRSAGLQVLVPALLQGGALLLLYSLGLIALARRRFGIIAMMSLTTATAAAAATFAADDAVSAARLSLVGTAGAVLLWLVWSIANDLVRPRLSEIAKQIAAVIALWLGATAIIQTLPAFPGRWMIAAAVGGAAFLAIVLALRVDSFLVLLPPGPRAALARALPTRNG